MQTSGIWDEFYKTAQQELRLKFFLKWKVYSYSQNLKLKSKIFHETGSLSLTTEGTLTGDLLIQVKIIVTLRKIWMWSFNTGGLLIQVFRSGLTVRYKLFVSFRFQSFLKSQYPTYNLSIQLYVWEKRCRADFSWAGFFSVRKTIIIGMIFVWMLSMCKLRRITHKLNIKLLSLWVIRQSLFGFMLSLWVIRRSLHIDKIHKNNVSFLIYLTTKETWHFVFVNIFVLNEISSFLLPVPKLELS